MTALLNAPSVSRKTNPLDPRRVLATTCNLAAETLSAIAADPHNFDAAMSLVETVVARFRSAFLAIAHHESDAALAYHDRALAELADEFVPLYYRRAVLENVLARYERASGTLQRALA